VCGIFPATSDIWHPNLSQYCINAAVAIVIGCTLTLTPDGAVTPSVAFVQSEANGV
jgi:hypothetical protein